MNPDEAVGAESDVEAGFSDWGEVSDWAFGHEVCFRVHTDGLAWEDGAWTRDK